MNNLLGPKLDSAETKVRRAGQHLHALKQSLTRFRNRDPYTIGVEQSASQFLVQPATLCITPTSPLYLPNAGLVGQILADSFIASVTLTPKLKPPVLRWGSIVGDIVHNLASALDNLVWELAHVNPNPRQLPPNASRKEREAWEHKRKSISFPYCKEPHNWSGACDRCLFFVDPDLYAIFEEAQPFYARQKDPEHHPLWVLHELWNRDKHRVINLATAAIGFKSIGTRMLNSPADAPELRTEPIRKWPIREIQGKTKVAEIRVHLPQAIAIPSKIDMYVNGDFTLGMLFGQGAPAEGDDVLDILWRARNEVVSILNKFA